MVIIPANTRSELVYLFETNQQLGSDYLRDLKKIVPDFYLGVYAAKNAQDYLDYVRSLSKQFDLPLVAVEDSEYLRPRDQFLQKTLRAIRSGQKMQDMVPLAKQDGSHYMVDAEQMLENALEIGARMLISGAEIRRVEDSIFRICTAYGSERTEVFSITYTIVATISSKNFGIITQSRRIHGSAFNLQELKYLNNLSRKICRTLPDMDEVKKDLKEIHSLPSTATGRDAHLCIDFICLYPRFLEVHCWMRRSLRS